MASVPYVMVFAMLLTVKHVSSACEPDFFGRDWWLILGRTRSETANWQWVHRTIRGITLIEDAGSPVKTAWNFPGETNAAQDPFVQLESQQVLGLKSFTLATFIKQNRLRDGPIFEWEGKERHRPGVHLWIYSNRLWLNIADVRAGDHFFSSRPPPARNWIFVGASFNQTNGKVLLWTGSDVAESVAESVITPDTSGDLYLGYRPTKGYGQKFKLTARLAAPIVLNGAITKSQIPKLKQEILDELGVTDEDGEYYNAEERLQTYLFRKYNARIRPVKNHTQNMTVTIALTGVALIDVNVQENTLKMKTYISLSWKDDRLCWKPRKYGNIKYIRVPYKSVWRPDIRLYNSVEPNAMTPPDDTKAIVRWYSGVYYVIESYPKVFCHKQNTSDTMDCYFKFGSWANTGDTIDLKRKEHMTEMDLVGMSNPTDWEVVSTSSKRKETTYACCPEVFIDIVYSIKLKRRGNSTVPVKMVETNIIN